MIDLQMHTTCSDGALTPDELVAKCAAEGLEVISVTDHDTVDHVAEVLEAGRRHGVQVIPGTELSVEWHGKRFHMLAYGFDYRAPGLAERLLDFRESRRLRAELTVDKLRECGLSIDLVDIQRLAGYSIGKPHMAQAVLNRPENVEILRSMGIASLGGVIEAFFDTGKPAFVEREKLSAREAIALVHSAGGICSIAHSGFTFRNEPERLEPFIEVLVRLGMDAVEVFYPMHDAAMTRRLRALTERLHVLETAGSDFHSPGASKELHNVGIWEGYGLVPNFPKFVY